LISDGSTKQLANDIVLNDMCRIDGEPKITFGFTKMQVLDYLWNVRISYPTTEIFMAAAVVKACFRFPRFSPDLAGVFGFMIKSLGHYYLSPAGVFGWKASCNGWEPFARAIQRMTAVVFSEVGENEEPHRDLVDLVKWDESPSKDQIFTQAIAEEIHQGVLDEFGNQKPIHSFMFVDDSALIANCAVHAPSTKCNDQSDLHCHGAKR
jgi:hypothetical protein